MSCKQLKEFHAKIGAVDPGVPTRPQIDHRFTRVRSMIVNAANTIIYEHENMNTGVNPTPPALAVLRVRLMAEELMEVVEAMAAGNMVALADGLADLKYVVEGTAVAYGIPLDEVFDVVHASNMSKTTMDKNSKGGKGEGYVAPEAKIQQLLGL